MPSKRRLRVQRRRPRQALQVIHREVPIPRVLRPHALVPGPHLNAIQKRATTFPLTTRRKVAMNYVVSMFNSARADIGADYDHTGAKPPSDKHIQSTGLGTDGSVWKSTLANAKREEIAGALSEITREFNWKCEDCYQDFRSEPDWVSKDDSRAKWHC